MKSAAGEMPDGQAAFRENESILLRFIASRVGCRATAEDIGQEVFLRVDRTPWASVTNPRAFLFKIAANLISNYKTQSRRRAELNEEVRDLLWSGVNEATPERHALAADELARVSAALQQLPERTRQILVWSRFDGLSHTDIARRLGISSQAVDKHVSKAVAHLTAAAGSGRK